MTVLSVLHTRVVFVPGSGTSQNLSKLAADCRNRRCSSMSSHCAAASALKLMDSALVEDNANTSMCKRASAAVFAIPLMCQMLVVNCET